MRYIFFILSILISQIANAQMVTQPGLGDYQMSGRNLPDSVLYILGTDTLDGSAKQGLGKFLTAESLRGFFKDTDWLKYRTGTIPNNTDTMYHVGVATVGDDSVYTSTNTLSGKLNVVGRLDLRFGEVQDYNIMIGKGSGAISMTGGLNIGIGSAALSSATTGNNNVAIGSASLTALTSGSRNFALGSSTLPELLTGNDNSALGNGALSLFLGSRATAIGSGVMNQSETGNDNTSIGYQSGIGLMTSGFNTIIGSQAGQTTDGASNVFIGYQSGRLNEGASNIFIGRESGENETGSELLYIDPTNTTTPLIKGDFAADTVRINGDLSIRDAVSGAATDSVLVWTPSNGRVKMRNAAAFGGSGATNLSIAQTGGTQVIQSSTGTDVGIRNLYGLLITEGATDTLHFRVDSSLFATTYDLTQIPISSLKDALAANTITGNANYKQEWQWNTLAGTDGLKLSSTSTAAASDLQKLFNVTLSGTNGTSGQDTYAGYFSNTHAGTTSTNYGLYGIATNGTTANYGVYGVANGSNGNGVVGSSSANIGVLGIGAIGVYASATSAVGVDANATSGIAIQGTATTGTGLEVLVTSGIPLSVLDNSAGTNTVEPMMQMYHLTSGTAAAGIGSSIVYNNEANDGSDYVSTTLKSLWTTATAGSRVSNFVISGVTAAVEADILTMKGSGQMQLNKYPGSFTGTAVNDLFIDASGNVIVGSMTGQSWTVDADDATTPILVSNQTLAFRGNRGINTDLIDGAVDSVSLVLDFSELVTVTTIDTDDNFAIWDAGTGMEEKITYANLITDIIADIPGGSDTNFGGDDLTWDANRVHDQSTYTTEIGGTNMTWKFQDNNATTGAQIILAGNVGNSDAPMGQIQFMYDDSGFATDQTAWTMVATRETDSQEHSTLEITANEASSAPPVATWEENENLSDNTQETSVRFNSGIAFTQSWESATTNAITLDRSYYNVVLNTGHTGTITLPQIYGIDESNIEIDAAQAPIGQEYVISNFSGSAVTIAAFQDSGTANDDWLNADDGSDGSAVFTLNNNESVIVKAVAIISSEGRWFTYD